MKHQPAIAIVVSFHLATAASLLAQSLPQVVTLSNGTQYYGQVATVGSFSSEILNPWNNATKIALVDDGLRRIFFNRDSAANLSPLDEDHPIANPTVFEIPQRVHHGNTRGFGNLQYGSFDENGHRKVKSTTTEGTTEFIQGITTITPYWCEVQTLANKDGEKLRQWTMRISTNSVPRNTLRNLLERQINDRKNPADYLAIVDFFTESNQFQMALEELSMVATKFPDIQEQIEDQQTVIRQARARQWIRQARDRLNAGQPQLAASMLRAFNAGGIAAEILAEMADLQGEIESSGPQIQAARKPIVELIDEFLSGDLQDKLEPDQVPMFERFKQELVSELNPENVARLDAFKRFAGDEQMTAMQKLSLALSGWFLGSNNATENFAVAQSFFVVRDLVVEYLTTANATRRQQIMEQLRKYEGGEPKYLAAMVAQLKPTHAPDLKDYNGSAPLSFEYEIPAPKAAEKPLKFSYHVQLPPEYNPYRRYPCIFTLPGDKDIDQQMMRWCGPFDQKLGIRLGQAMTNGYIVVCVDWKLPGQFEYGYTAREHSAILTAFRQALRQFSIDTDRVFIAGHGFGADAAYDIGIAHPDHWAGVVGISGKIDRYPVLYKDHKHVRLPIYSVVGEKDLVSKGASEQAWNRWLPSKAFFDCTVVEYKGRSNEPFLAEIVEVFKWARGHRRKLPDNNGFTFEECKVLRPWDNYFWFFELHKIPENKVEWPAFFQSPFPRSPLEMAASLSSNRFMLQPSNLSGGATIWLSPEFIDFEKKIQIGVRDFKDHVSPSRQVLLEDVRGRSDRQHPYWANIRFRGKDWQPNMVE